MGFKIGDVVSLKSSPEVKMTVREIIDTDVVCDWFNKEEGRAYMSQAEFKSEQLTNTQS